MIQIVIKTLAILTLFSQIAFLILLFTKKIQKKLARYSLHLVLIISSVATLGSLFFSEVAQFAPCVLCWYQRIFMYPQPLLIALALFKKNKELLLPYLQLLNIIGATIALYHYILQKLPAPLVCSTNSISCTKNVAFYFSYISIPMMALTAFIINLYLLKIKK